MANCESFCISTRAHGAALGRIASGSCSGTVGVATPTAASTNRSDGSDFTDRVKRVASFGVGLALPEKQTALSPTTEAVGSVQLTRYAQKSRVCCLSLCSHSSFPAAARPVHAQLH